MSVLIKGMDKPQNCFTCPLKFVNANVFVGCRLPNKCPLVEVPTPHGRLIDADEAHIDADERGFDFWACDADIDSAQEFLKAQPTIIEAEDGESRWQMTAFT